MVSFKTEYINLNVSQNIIGKGHIFRSCLLFVRRLIKPFLLLRCVSGNYHLHFILMLFACYKNNEKYLKTIPHCATLKGLVISLIYAQTNTQLITQDCVHSIPFPADCLYYCGAAGDRTKEIFISFI